MKKIKYTVYKCKHYINKDLTYSLLYMIFETEHSNSVIITSYN